MKKFLIFLMFTSFMLSIHSENAINFLIAEEVKPGIIWFAWEGDTAKSYAYSISIAKLDNTTNELYIFSGIAAFDYLLTIDGRPGILQCSTNLVLQYGDNYLTIGSHGANSNVVAEWELLWGECVNEEDYTLVPGTYVIYVFGVDNSYVTTEEEDYIIAEIRSVAVNISEINAVEYKTVKYLLPNGEMRILNGDNIYDVNGHKIK